MSMVHYASQTKTYDYICGAAKKLLDDYPTTIESLVTCPACLALLNAPDAPKSPPGTVAELLPGIEEITRQEAGGGLCDAMRGLREAVGGDYDDVAFHYELCDGSGDTLCDGDGPATRDRDAVTCPRCLLRMEHPDPRLLVAELAALRKRITDRADELDGFDEDSFYSAGAVADDLRRLLED